MRPRATVYSVRISRLLVVGILPLFLALFLAVSASGQLPALPYLLDQGGFSGGNTGQRPFVPVNSTVPPPFMAAGRTLPAMAGYRGRIVYFDGPDIVVSGSGSNPEHFVLSRHDTTISRGFNVSRLAVVGETIYAAAISNTRGKVVTLLKGEPDPAAPSDPMKIKWEKEPASPLPWKPGQDQDSRKSESGRENLVQIEAMSVIKPGVKTVSNDLFCLGVVGTRIVALRFTRPGWVEEDKLNTDADIVKMKTATVQLADNTYAIAVGWIEINNNGRQWKLALFDGKTFRRVNAVADAQTLYPTTDIYLAYGSVEGGTTGRNLLQIFLEEGGVGKDMPQITLLRAEYELGGKEGNEGSMMVVAKGKWDHQYLLWPLFPNEGGWNSKLCTERISEPNGDQLPVAVKIFLTINNVALKENGPLPGIETVKDNRYRWREGSNFGIFTYRVPEEVDSKTNQRKGYVSRICLAGAMPNDKLYLLQRNSNRLVRSAFARANNQWSEVPNGNTTPIEMANADDDPAATRNSQGIREKALERSWIFLGTVYGVPPFARNGAQDVSKLSSVTFTKSDSGTNSVRSTKEATFTQGLKGEFFKGLLSVESSFSGTYSQEINRSVRWSTHITDRFAPRKSEPVANVGYLFFLAPKIRIESLKMADWTGNVLKDPRTGTSMALTIARTTDWEVVRKTFRMDGSEPQSQWARGVRTNKNWISTNLSGWRNVADDNDKSYELTRGPKLVVTEDSTSPEVTLEASASDTRSETTTRAFKVGAFLGIVGAEYERSFAVETEASMEGGFSIKFAVDLEEPSKSNSGSQFSAWNVRPIFLREKPGGRAFFVPEDYRNQKLQPFCVIYEVDGIQSYQPNESRRNSEARQDSSPVRVAGSVFAGSDSTFAVASGGNMFASAPSSAVSTDVSDSASEDRALPVLGSISGGPILTVNGRHRIRVSDESRSVIRGRVQGSSSAVRAFYRLSDSDGSLRKVVRVVQIGKNGNWTFRIPAKIAIGRGVTFQANDPFGAVSAPVRVVLER